MTHHFSQSASPSALRILVCASDPLVHAEVRHGFVEPDWTVDAVQSLKSVAELTVSERPDVCLVDESKIGVDFARSMSLCTRDRDATQYVFLVQNDAHELRVLLRRYSKIAGIEFHVLEKPAGAQNVRAIADAVIAKSRLSSENDRLRVQVQNKTLYETLGSSHHIVKLCARVTEAARTSQPITIQGQRGTGKPKIARAIHDASCQSEHPFVALNCRLLAESQLESQLFEVSSTDASQREKGIAGTLFLSGVEFVSESLQRRVLQSIVSSTGMRDRFWFSTMRLIVSANSASDDVRQAEPSLVTQLNGIHGAMPIQLLPLSEHREDIPVLARNILRQESITKNQTEKQISDAAVRVLSNYDWPGNIRELRQVLEQVCASEDGNIITAESIGAWFSSASDANEDVVRPMTLKDMERKFIEATFCRCGGNRERTARELQIGIRTLSGKLREYGYPPRGGPGSNQRESLRKAA